MDMMEFDDKMADIERIAFVQAEGVEEAETDKTEEPVEEEPVVVPPQSKGKEPPITPRKGSLKTEAVVLLFSACQRCCYFLAGYQVAHGRPNLETAALQSKAGWLTLNWNRQTRELIHKSFGNEIDTGCYHFEGCCPECRRHFIYRAANGHNLVDTLRVEIRPQSRH